MMTTHILQRQGQIPIHWLGRIVNGFFVFSMDAHLCHITQIATTEYMVYSPFTNPPWEEFNPHQPISSAQSGLIILQPASHPPSSCLGLDHIIARNM